VNAANSGFLHVIAAEHVMAEVASHHVEWATDRGETPERFWEVWSSLYVPLIRVVPSVESDVFINPELDRLALLSEKDNDDRPSAELAILLKGVFLSEDLPATDAVYGGLRSKEDLHAWRQTLGAGGDAGVLRSIFDAGEVSLRLLGGGIVGVARAISKAPPWAQFLIAGAAIAVSFALTARSTKVNSGPANAETRPVKESLAMAAEVILGMADAYSEARQKLIRAEPVQADWESMSAALATNAFVVRAVSYALARMGSSDSSAAEISALLRTFGVSISPSSLRATLRSERIFFEVRRGRWTLGKVPSA
jgi:hypothetical protein